MLWTDAPFAALFGFYSFMTGLCRETRRSLERTEASALERCAATLYSSDWAAEAARASYKIAPERMRGLCPGVRTWIERLASKRFASSSSAGRLIAASYYSLAPGGIVRGETSHSPLLEV